MNAFYLLIASKLDLTLYHHWGKVLGEYFPPGLQCLPPLLLKLSLKYANPVIIFKIRLITLEQRIPSVLNS